MLSYLPGETIGDRMPWPAWVSADSMLPWVPLASDAPGPSAAAGAVGSDVGEQSRRIHLLLDGQ